MSKIIDRGIKVQAKIKELTNTPLGQRTSSPQVKWDHFKTNLRMITKEVCKNENHRMQLKITNLHDNINSKMNNPEIDNNEQA
jgi:hypothetical protein